MTQEKSQTEVHFSHEGAVATIRFVPTSGVNIFSTRVVTALGTVVEQVASDPVIRFVIFRGDGRVFLAGADISEMQSFDEARARTFGNTGHRVFNAIESLPQVTIAAINGHALGGGCELAMSCDFRIAVKDAKLGQPEIRLGLIPGWGGTLRLPKLVGLAQARRLLLTGDAIGAEEALRIGLVDEVVPSADELEAAVQRRFKSLAPGAPHAASCIKRSLISKDEIGEFARCFTSPNAREGTTAFLEKRAPEWANWPPT